MITILDEVQEIQVSTGVWTGQEKVFLNKNCVSSRWSFSGSHHVFKSENQDCIINYDVELGLRWHGFGKYVIVRKNGIIIFTDR